MPQLHRFANKVKICMYPDHAPPHFHLRGPDWSVMIKLSSLSVMRGKAPKKELARAIRWAKDNRAFLESEWKRLNERDD